MTVPPSQPRGRALIQAALIAQPVLQAANLFLVADSDWRKALSDLFQAAAALLAFVACVQAARKLRRENDPAAAAWTAVAVAAGLWAAGMVYFMVVEVGLRQDPYPGGADVFFFAFYPVMAWGLARFPTEPATRREQWNRVLEIAALGTVAGLGVWQFNLRLVTRSLATTPNLGTWFSLVYAVLDFVLLLLVFARMEQRLARGRHFVPMLLLTLGCFCLAPANLLQGYVTTYSNFASGSPADLGWVLFSVLVGLSALHVLKEDSPARAKPCPDHVEWLRNVWATGLTYGWIGLVMAMLVWALGHRDELQSGVVIGGVAAAILLAITRHVSALHESVELYRQLEQANATLERRVMQRTAQLQEQRARLEVSEGLRRRVFEGSPMAIVVLDATTLRFLDCNPAAVAIYRLEQRENVIGKTPGDVSTPLQYDGEASAAAARRHIEQALAMGDDKFEWRHRRPDGEVWDAEVILQRFDAGDRLQLQFTLRDITDRKRAEAERASLQSQLIQAQKMEAVGQLAGGVAHDFNNILTVFLMQIAFLHEEPALSPGARLGLSELGEAARRAVGLTRQLLLFSRRQVAQKQRLDLDSLLGNLLKMLRRLIGEDISIEFRGASEATWVLADGGMLEQVVMNLVVNARDAMPEGGRITLDTGLVEIAASRAAGHPEACAGRFVRLHVTDTGCGMEAGTLERIFEPFFTTKPLGTGTGLGLATVFGIVKQHDGWVEVESAVGKGTTFSVFLPESRRPDTGVTDGAAVSPVAGGEETILVVEDNPEVRDLATTSLRRLGYRVFVAESGQKALEQWPTIRDHVNLLLTDMIMPEGHTGLELTRRLMPDRPDLRVIIMSGYSLELAAYSNLGQNRFRFLQKPFDPSGLGALVRRCLDAA